MPLLRKDAAAPPIYAARETGPSPMDALGARVKTVEERFKAWTSKHSGLADRLSQVEKSLSAGVRGARAETTAFVEGLKREMNRSFEVVNSRLGRLEDDPETPFWADFVVGKSFVSEAEFSTRGLSGSSS